MNPWLPAIAIVVSMVFCSLEIAGVAAEADFDAELIFPLHPKHNHAPGIVEGPNGDLIASWYRGSGERRADDVAVYGARRRSGAPSWSDAFVMADTPGFPDCNTALWIDRDARLWLFWPVILANTWESCLTQYRVAKDFSADGPPKWDWQGSIFLAPEKMPEDLRAGFEEWKKRAGERKFSDYSKVEAIEKTLADKLFQRLGWQPRCKPTVLPGGRIVFPLYTDTFSVSIMALSDDGGRSWRPSRILAGIGNIQPAVLRRRDGSLAAYMRENGPLDRVRVAESRDEGETWGAVGTVDSLPNPGSGLDGLVLASGAWVLVHNDTVQGRKSLALSLSEDEGATWRTARHLERSGEGSYHYPAIIQGRDGRIHAVYTYSSAEGSSMKHAAFSENWLKSPETAETEPRWGRCLAQPPEWYGSDGALGIAARVVAYQRASGGWPKDIDMAQPLEAERLRKVEADAARNDATIDNGATHRQLQFLARVHTATGRGKLREAFERGLDLLLGAQGASGGWPQRFEGGEAYQKHITFNDGAMAGVLDLLGGIAAGRPPFAFVDEKRRRAAASAVDRGIACILKCQVVLDGRPTVWCAQHDETTLEPRPARRFEPLSLSGGESAELARLLMEVERPGPEVVRAVEGAVAWFERTKVQGKRWEEKEDPAHPGRRDRILMDDPAAKALWARFYEIPSMRPIFGDRDGSVHYRVEEISHERRTGYAWYGDWPARLLEREYPAWRKRLGL